MYVGMPNIHIIQVDAKRPRTCSSIALNIYKHLVTFYSFAPIPRACLSLTSTGIKLRVSFGLRAHYTLILILHFFFFENFLWIDALVLLITPFEITTTLRYFLWYSFFVDYYGRETDIFLVWVDNFFNYSILRRTYATLLFALFTYLGF